MNKTILECIDINKFYYNQKKIIYILKNISFKVYPGNIIVIIGKSGSGKSTLLHIINGLDQPNSGLVLFEGIELRKMSENQIANIRNSKIGFIYQFHHLLLDFNVLENVAMPLLINNKSIKESKEIAYQMLKKVYLDNKTNQYPSSLSGGERQRVAIARALVNKPILIIADEPTSNLDQYNKDIIFNLILELNNYLNTSFIIVTHDSFCRKKTSMIFKMENNQLFSK